MNPPSLGMGSLEGEVEKCLVILLLRVVPQFHVWRIRTLLFMSSLAAFGGPTCAGEKGHKHYQEKSNKVQPHGLCIACILVR